MKKTIVFALIALLFTQCTKEEKYNYDTMQVSSVETLSINGSTSIVKYYYSDNYLKTERYSKSGVLGSVSETYYRDNEDEYLYYTRNGGELEIMLRILSIKNDNGEYTEELHYGYRDGIEHLDSKHSFTYSGSTTTEYIDNGPYINGKQKIVTIDTNIEFRQIRSYINDGMEMYESMIISYKDEKGNAYMTKCYGKGANNTLVYKNTITYDYTYFNDGYECHRYSVPADGSDYFEKITTEYKGKTKIVTRYTKQRADDEWKFSQRVTTTYK